MSRLPSVTRHFNRIADLVPPQVRTALAAEVPKLEETIDQEVDSFGQQLSLFIKSELAIAEAEQKQALTDAKLAVQQELNALLTAGSGDGALKTQVLALQKAIDAYEQRWIGVGEKLNTVVKRGLAAAGVPLP